MRLTTPKWLLGHALVVAVVVSFTQFGFWQLRRHAERSALNEVTLARASAAPVSLDEALAAAAAEVADGADPALALRDRRVRVAGWFEPDDEVLRRPVSRDGMPGYHVVTPLRLEGDPTGAACGWSAVGCPTREPRAGRRGAAARGTRRGRRLALRATTAPPQGWVAAIAPRDPPTGRLAQVAYLDPERLRIRSAVRWCRPCCGSRRSTARPPPPGACRGRPSPTRSRWGRTWGTPSSGSPSCW
jgi:hypothetical protein